MSGDFVTGPIAVEESVSGLDRMPVQAADGFGVDEPDSIRIAAPVAALLQGSSDLNGNAP
jgi:hypothetical protein